MRHSILFVDDEKPVLSSLAFSFEGAYNVFTAQSGAEALDVIKSQKVSVIVSDQRMPVMSGAELLSKVKELSPMTMRILLTGYADLDAIMASLNAGSVFRFVNKPWNTEKLHATIQLACQIYQQMVDVAGQPNLAGESKPVSTQKKSVLFIDTPSNLVALSNLFRDEYRVHTAESFEGALNVVQSVEVSAVTTEATLNGEESVSFLAALRQIKPNAATVMLTGSQDASLAVRLINEGRVFRYLVKPFTRQTLRETLRQATEQYGNPLASESLARHFEHKKVFNGDLPSQHAGNLSEIIRRVNAKLAATTSY